MAIIPKCQALSRSSVFFHLTLAITLYFAFTSCLYAFSSEYIVQDDVRQWSVWAEKLVDQSLFPNSYLARYGLEQWNNAPGAKWLYELGIIIGIRPLMLAKLLPGFLGLLTSVFYFKFCLRIFPSELCAFLSTVILAQNMWMHSDLSSASPRAFLFPIFSGFLYCISHQRLGLSLIFTALQTLFYPPLVLINLCIVSLRCLDWAAWPLILSKRKQPYFLAIASFVMVFLLLLPILTRDGNYGPLVTRQQMASMAEFAENGRTPFFVNNPLSFWLDGTSGLNLPYLPYAIWLAYGLPFFLKLRFSKKQVKGEIDSSLIKTTILMQMGVAALLLFFAAHLLLFRLYWPSRYPYHTFPFIFSVSAGIVLTLWIFKVRQWLWGSSRQKFLAILSTGLMTILLTLPFVPSISLGNQGWVNGTSPDLYRFISRQPKDILIAGLGDEISNIPAFTLRSVLFSPETAIAFHLEIYSKIKTRIVKVITGQYTADPNVIQSVIETYGIDYWLIDRDAFTQEYLTEKGNTWLLQYEPQIEQAQQSLKSGETPAMMTMIKTCSVVENYEVVLLDANCMTHDSL